MFGGIFFIKYILLYPISLLYGLVVSIRNFLYDSKILRSKSFDFPVISIGNISVGGTGKTPHVEYIIRLLNADKNIAMLSRGYKRKTKGYRLANSEDTAQTIGDEPRQIQMKFPNIHVAVDENRVHGVKMLCEDLDIKAVILDDAFQHRKITPGLNIILTDYNRPFTKDHFLPYGRLREHPQEHRRAHIIIVTKCPKDMKPIEKRLVDKEIKIYPFQYLFFTYFEYGNLVNIFDKKSEIPLIDLKNKHVLGVSGIANNNNFQEKLKETSKQFDSISFMDHHKYTAKDIHHIQSTYNNIVDDNKIIVTTEKDVEKLKMAGDWDESIKNNVYYMPIQVAFLGNNKEEKAFKTQIIKYVETNRRYSKLYKGQDIN